MVVLSVASRAGEIFESLSVQTSDEKILFQLDISKKIHPPTRFISKIIIAFYRLAVVEWAIESLSVW